jgi:hypothetical protein
MKAMLATAEQVVGGQCTGEKSGGNRGAMWQEAYLELPLAHDDSTGALAIPRAVLLEIGQTGGPWPSQVRSVESLLLRQLSTTPLAGQWDDLRPFDVAILHPGRTLIEKLLRVNNFVVDPSRRTTAHGLPRIGRQFYDIWALLGDDSVTALLADKSTVGEILTSALHFSQQMGRPDHPLPDGGFAASEAFDPGGVLAVDLRSEHDTAMRSIYFGTDPPTFDDVLDRVHSCAQLLNP